MPLIIEAYDEETESWIEVREVMPGDPPGSMSDNNLVTGRHLYLFVCDKSDLFSTVYRMNADHDMLIGPLRAMEGQGTIKIREIGSGETYEKDFLTDVSPVTRHARFRHLTLDLGTRKCRICGQKCQPWLFGQHIIEHSEADLKGWPGGVGGLLKSLKASVKESIKKTDDFPQIQQNLQATLDFFERLEKGWKSPFN